MERPTPADLAKADERGVCYGSGMTTEPIENRRDPGGWCPVCGRPISFIVSNHPTPSRLNWHRPWPPKHPDIRRRAGRVRVRRPRAAAKVAA